MARKPTIWASNVMNLSTNDSGDRRTLPYRHEKEPDPPFPVESLHIPEVFLAGLGPLHHQAGAGQDPQSALLHHHVVAVSPASQV